MIKAKELTISETILFLVVNLVGAMLYVVFVYQIERGQIIEGRQDYNFSDSLNYMTQCLPELLLCSLINAILGARGVVTDKKLKTYRRWPIFILNVGLWAFIFLMEIFFKFSSQDWNWWDWFGIPTSTFTQ